MEKPDIIVIDDDIMVAELSRDLLVSQGWSVLLLNDSRSAFKTIKENMPKMVISDIMMPGITGLDICKMIKTDPSTKSIKVIIVSGKSYEVEKQRAFQLGADFFLAKPYNIETFSKTVKSILEGASPTSAPPPPPSKEPSEKINQINPIKSDEAHLTFNGLRGMPSLLPVSQSKFGRQTMCMSIETSKNIFIFDAGSGIINLGREIISNKRYYKEIWLFISHFHLDNVMGLPYFEPLFDSKFTIHIAGPNDPEKSLKENIRSNFYSSFSPIKSAPNAKIDLYQVFEDNYEISPEFKITTMYANHPTSTIIYFINLMGLKITYAPDSEIWGDATALQDYDERLGNFSKNSDIFIHDAYYDESDYEKNSKRGHSSINIVTEFAIKNSMKTFVPFNLNPEYEDNRIEKMKEKAEEIAKQNSSDLKILLPQENQKIILNSNK